ncbi:hypothetical protein CHUAL_012415 [Chamberlinius hualienensis]
METFEVRKSKTRVDVSHNNKMKDLRRKTLVDHSQSYVNGVNNHLNGFEQSFEHANSQVDLPSVINYTSHNEILPWKWNTYSKFEMSEIEVLPWGDHTAYFYINQSDYSVRVRILLNRTKHSTGSDALVSGDLDLLLTRSFARALSILSCHIDLNDSCTHTFTILLFNQLASTKNVRKTIAIAYKDKCQHFLDILKQAEIGFGGFVNGDCLHYKIIGESK